MRQSTPDAIYAEFAECHRQAGARFVVGPGCETPRDTPHENFRAMLRYAREHNGQTMPGAMSQRSAYHTLRRAAQAAGLALSYDSTAAATTERG